MNLIIVGGSGGTHVGDALYKAAVKSNFDAILINALTAYEAPIWIRRFNWYVRGKRPTKLNSFSQEVIQKCREIKPKFLLSTGYIAAIHSQALQEIKEMGVQTINFLTDDPWNRAHYAPWFLQALSQYNVIFSPRRANLVDLKRLGCPNVEYLSFGYDSELFYPDTSSTQSETDRFKCDIVFAGGADRERIPYLDALIRTGFKVDLYGDYWERYPATKDNSRGYADSQMLRSIISNAKIALCLVRRANRDGHVMRTFEIPAIGACMLTEDTQEHREIFGEEGEAVVYFQTISEMVEKAHWLLAHDQERQQLAHKAHLLITQGEHTYSDRLKTMLNLIPSFN